MHKKHQQNISYDLTTVLFTIDQWDYSMLQCKYKVGVRHNRKSETPSWSKDRP